LASNFQKEATAGRAPTSSGATGFAAPGSAAGPPTSGTIPDAAENSYALSWAIKGA